MSHLGGEESRRVVQLGAIRNGRPIRALEN